MAWFRITYRPNRRAGFHDRWHPLLDDIQADRAVVGAVSVYGQLGLHRFDATLYRHVTGTFGRADSWAFVGIAASIRVNVALAAVEPRYGDHILLLHPVAAPVWECKWCQARHDDLPAAAVCAARCWDAKRAARAEAERRFFENNRDVWWAPRG